MARHSRLVVVALTLIVLFPAAPLGANDLQSTLDRIIDDGQGHEMALRMIRMGMEVDPSKIQKRKQARFGCSLTKRTGSHVKYLRCDENEILNYLVEAGALRDEVEESPIFPFRKEASMYFSENPTTEGRLHDILSVTGPASLNRELVAGVLKGEPLPDGMPGQAEIEAFAEALAAVKAVRDEYDPRIHAAAAEEKQRLIAESDGRMVQGIQDTGLSVARYNEISSLIAEYGSLRQAVVDRMPGER